MEYSTLPKMSSQLVGGKKKKKKGKNIIHLWKISNFKWHTLTWGPNLCNAVSGWVSWRKRSHTRRGGDMHTHTHTRDVSQCASASLFLLHTHAQTHRGSNSEAVRHGGGQINGFGPEAFLIIALEP